jgi:hypothetical protein
MPIAAADTITLKGPALCDAPDVGQRSRYGHCTRYDVTKSRHFPTRECGERVALSLTTKNRFIIPTALFISVLRTAVLLAITFGTTARPCRLRRQTLLP